MAMTLEELELESAELIPAREVMCAVHPPCHRSGGYFWSNSGQNDSGNGAFQIGLLNVNNVLNNISVDL